MWERMAKDFVTFITKNPLYLVCSVAYYLFTSWAFGGEARHYVLALFLYLLSLLVAFSPLGEKILRLIEKARKIETKREKELLYPLIEEVYPEAKKRCPHLGYIDLCIIDKVTVQACAMGKHTIAITKGAIETFSADELKSIIAHEIAHIVYLDTMARLYAIIGNGIYAINFIVLRFIMNAIELMHSVEGTSKAMGLGIRLVRLLIELTIFLTMILMQAVLAIDSRKSEFRADQFAYELGYGEDLISALYLLETINLGDDSGIVQKMIAGHPRITARIEKLEMLVDYGLQQPQQPYVPYNASYSQQAPYGQMNYQSNDEQPPFGSHTNYYQPPYSPPPSYMQPTQPPYQHPFSYNGQPQGKQPEEGLPF